MPKEKKGQQARQRSVEPEEDSSYSVQSGANDDDDDDDDYDSGASESPEQEDENEEDESGESTSEPVQNEPQQTRGRQHSKKPTVSVSTEENARNTKNTAAQYENISLNQSPSQYTSTTRPDVAVVEQTRDQSRALLTKKSHWNSNKLIASILTIAALAVILNNSAIQALITDGLSARETAGCPSIKHNPVDVFAHLLDEYPEKPEVVQMMTPLLLKWDSKFRSHAQSILVYGSDSKIKNFYNALRRALEAEDKAFRQYTYVLDPNELHKTTICSYISVNDDCPHLFVVNVTKLNEAQVGVFEELLDDNPAAKPTPRYSTFLLLYADPDFFYTPSDDSARRKQEVRQSLHNQWHPRFLRRIRETVLLSN